MFGSNIFQGLNNAPLAEGGHPKIAAGFDGDLKVLKTLVKQTQNAGLAFIAELEVVTSNHPSHAQGSVVSYFQSMNQQQVAFSNIKEFIVAAWGCDKNDPAQVAQLEPHIETILNQAVSSPTQNQLIGRSLHCRGEERISQSSGRTYVRKSWSVATGQAGAPVVAPAAPAAQPMLGPGTMPTLPQAAPAPGMAPGMPPMGIPPFGNQQT